MAREYKIQKTKPVSASGIDYGKELNPEQFAAVSSPPGKSLVIAGAGSGKTRTLTYRVSWLLDQGGTARNILLLTFTNKSAREMVERVRSLCPRRCLGSVGWDFPLHLQSHPAPPRGRDWIHEIFLHS